MLLELDEDAGSFELDDEPESLLELLEVLSELDEELDEELEDDPPRLSFL